jgi:hypothetical protein
MAKHDIPWPAWLGLPFPLLGASALIARNFVRDDLAPWVMWTSLVLTLLWVAIVGLLWLRAKRSEFRPVCKRCGQRVPNEFLEEVSGAGNDGGSLVGNVPRGQLVACRHCLHGEDYPK